jgi:hypothetical protein
MDLCFLSVRRTARSAMQATPTMDLGAIMIADGNHTMHLIISHDGSESSVIQETSAEEWMSIHGASLTRHFATACICIIIIYYYLSSMILYDGDERGREKHA